MLIKKHLMGKKGIRTHDLCKKLWLDLDIRAQMSNRTCSCHPSVERKTAEVGGNCTAIFSAEEKAKHTRLNHGSYCQEQLSTSASYPRAPRKAVSDFDWTLQAISTHVIIRRPESTFNVLLIGRYQLSGLSNTKAPAGTGDCTVISSLEKREVNDKAESLTFC
jgi:hypothetical protein